ncbi:MAG: glycosyltransferase family 4 protein [Prevotella sp.]|nr:glycosyltransferase family 4 protein [Prevotella sp.]
MNIIYVIEDYSENGGVERIVSDKANTLSTQYQHNVTVITVYRDNRKEQYRLNDEINLIYLDVPFARRTNNSLLRLISRLYTIFIAIIRLNKVIKRLNPDIIFFTTTLGAILLPFCHTKARKIYESHLARNFNPFNKLFFLTELRAERIVCLTSGDAKEYKYAKRVDVIPNYINDIKSHVEDYSVKKAIAVGRLEYQKGFDILIDCWKEIAKQYPDWKLDIYGEGACREELQHQIDSLELGNKVKLCGRNNNIIDVYPLYSLHLMTSRYEGLPMTLIEAQACGLPSVVFDYQYGASDIVSNGHNGLIIEQANSKQLIEAAMKMMSSEKLRKQYGTNALEIGKRYSKENIFNKWIELIT